VCHFWGANCHLHDAAAAYLRASDIGPEGKVMNVGSEPLRPLIMRVAAVALCAWVALESAQFAAAIAESRPNAWLAIATAGIVLSAALVSSIVGFAFAALAGGAFALFKLEPVSAVHTILVCSFAIQLYAVWKLRAAIRWQPIAPLLAGGVLTLPFGVWLLVRIDATHYAAALGVFLVGYGVYLLRRRETHGARLAPWTAVLAGAVGGITGGIAGLPGASATIWCAMRGGDKQQQRAIYQPYILVMQMLTMLVLRWQAPFATHSLDDLAFVPFALFGAIGGLALFQRMTHRHFSVASSALLLISGIGLLAKAV
jgi:uncharacterized membrane protein YfcA